MCHHTLHLTEKRIIKITLMYPSCVCKNDENNGFHIFNPSFAPSPHLSITLHFFHFIFHISVSFHHYNFKICGKDPLSTKIMKKKTNYNNNNINFKILGMPTQQTFSVLLETKPISHQKILALTVSNSFFSFNFIRFSPSQWNNRLLAKARLSASELLPHLFHSNC